MSYGKVFDKICNEQLEKLLILGEFLLEEDRISPLLTKIIEGDDGFIYSMNLDINDKEAIKKADIFLNKLRLMLAASAYHLKECKECDLKE
jgi:hypothetical protein